MERMQLKSGGHLSELYFAPSQHVVQEGATSGANFISKLPAFLPNSENESIAQE
jgi:hypothetical protein